MDNVLVTGANGLTCSKCPLFSATQNDEQA